MATPSLLKAALSGALGVGIAAGCTWMKADPAPDSNFLAHPEKMEEHRERAPLHRMWMEEDFHESDYDSIVVAPVDTKHVLEQSTWAQANTRRGGQGNLPSSSGYSTPCVKRRKIAGTPHAKTHFLESDSVHCPTRWL